MPAPAPLEVEAKLAAAGEWDLRAVAGLDSLGPYLLRDRESVRLRSIYFDTRELILARHGVALRARRQGRRWEITIKWAGEVHGSVHERPELTEPLPKAPKRGTVALSPAFRRELNALLAGRRVHPVLVTEIRRQLRDVHRADNGTGAPLAEIALDQVLLRAPDGSDERASYCEIEVERKEGTAEDVDQLAGLLQRQFGLAPSRETKFSHGMALLHGPALGAYEKPLADGSLRRLAQRLVSRHLEALRRNDPGARRGDEAEALHDMRVASRRLRALLRFFADAFPARQATALRADLRWLNEALSPVRDCDVQLQTLDRYEAELSPGRRRGLAPYREHIVAERERHRRAMLEALDSKRYFSALQRLETFSSDARPTRRAAAQVPAARIGRRALKHAFRKLLRGAERVGPVPTAEELHRIRIRAKRLRYLLEFFRDSIGKPGARLLKHLVRLQDRLGTHNDAMVAARFLERYVRGIEATSRPPTVSALGAFLEDELRRARRARTRYRRTWERFDSGKAVDDWKAVHRLLRKEAAAVDAAGEAGEGPTGEQP